MAATVAAAVRHGVGCKRRCAIAAQSEAAQTEAAQSDRSNDGRAAVAVQAPGPPAPVAGPIHFDSLLVVDFASGGTSAAYRTDGWGGPESRLSWGLGPRSGLRLPAPWDRRPRVLELDVNPCRHHPVACGQLLRIQVNGWQFGEHMLAQRTLIRCRLEPIVWKGCDALDISLEHPYFFVPKRLRMSGDARPLAVSCFSARLYAEHAPRPGIVLPTLPATDGVERVVLAQVQAQPVPPANAAPVAAAAADGQPNRYLFGHHGAARQLTREGWALPEPGFQWTGSTFARIELPAPAGPGPHLLQLDFVPFTVPEQPAQEVAVTLGGKVIGQFAAAAPSVLGLPLPDDLVSGQDSLRLGLHVPDAIRPCDVGLGQDSRLLGLSFRAITLDRLAGGARRWAGRRVDDIVPPAPVAVSDMFCATPDDALAAAVHEALGMAPADLLRAFESLGENCEFGMAQRKLGVEALGLFRFGYTPLVGLLRAFEDDFAAAADPAAVTIALNAARRPEYYVALERYGIRWHTFVHADEADAETTLQKQATKLGFLRRKFQETLQAGRKIFILKRDRPLTLAEVLPVLQAVGRHGANTLMYVVPGAAPGRSGTVELLVPGLLRGHVTAFAPGEDVLSVAVPEWVRLCANAWRLARAHPLTNAAIAPPPDTERAPPELAGDGPAAPRPAVPAVETFAGSVSDQFCGVGGADLAAAIRTQLGVAAPELLRDFESLGDNCEFGMAQRKLGAEVLGLFRFGFTPLAGLLRAFEDDFAGAADPAAVSIALNAAKRREYYIAIERYGIRFHTFVHEDEADAETTLQKQTMKLGYLRRRFQETLRASRKLFVLKRARPLLTEAEVQPVLQAINRAGRNSLLFIVPGAAPERSGAVERLAPNLMRGHIASFAPNEDVESVCADDWLRLAANAWRLHHSNPPPASHPHGTAA
jgi:hypothetical protein